MTAGTARLALVRPVLVRREHADCTKPRTPGVTWLPWQAEATAHRCAVCLPTTAMTTTTSELTRSPDAQASASSCPHFSAARSVTLIRRK
jgi:hypothetical protein